MTIPAHLYRKAPAGSIFAQAETVLSESVWTEGSVAPDGSKLFSFTATSASSYNVIWEDVSDGGGYTGDIQVAAYKSDQATSFFIKEEAPPQTVALGAGQKIFVIVEEGGVEGTFRVMVQPVS